MRTDATSREPTSRRQLTGWITALVAAIVVVVVGYAVLVPRAPGNAAAGFLGGGIAVIVLVAVDRWRVHRGSTRVGPAARWAAGTPDERDDRILTRSLAVVGLVGILGSCLAAMAYLLGVDAEILVGALPMVLIATLVATFVVISRRS